MRAAAAVARAHGLDAAEPRVISDRSNALVRLGPVVAWVATTTALVRAGAAFDWLARDVALAGWLAGRGVPVVPPADELPPGPHLEDGFAISFWRHVEVAPDAPPTPDEAREALARLHLALEGYPGELPPLVGFVDECEVVAERLAPTRPGLELHRVRRELERLRAEIAALPARPLHGDAARGNLLRTPEGLLWTDLEDARSGPLEWDLACMERSIERAPGEGPFRELRELQGRLWRALLERRGLVDRAQLDHGDLAM